MRKLALIAMLQACGDSTTALDLELLPSPELNSAADLVSRIRTVVVVVDAATGRLYPPESEQLAGNVQIKNADADPGDLELVALVPMPGDHLPLIRIERGGLPDVPLHIRVLGSAEGETGTEMARGGATGVSFSDGEIETVAVPFNLLPRWLPLMVTEVAPSDGASVPCDSKVSILSVFSRAVDAASVTAPGHITVVELPSADVAAEELAVSLNSVTFVPDRAVLSYRLTISTDVTDADGAHLDQVPSMQDLQPYREDFQLMCDGTSMPTFPVCSAAVPDGPCPGPAGRFRCEAGECVPNACDGAACSGGFVCDPASSLCEVDCRLYGGEACPATRPVCSTNGYCVP